MTTRPWSPVSCRALAGAVFAFALALLCPSDLVPRLHAQAPGEFERLTQFGTLGSASDIVRAVATDAAGNVYAAGLTLGNLAGPNQGGADIFVRKYAPDGSVLATSQLGTSANDNASAIFVDATGVYVGGSTDGDLDGPGPEANAGGSDGFVLGFGLDLTGPTFIEQFGSPAPDAVRGLAGNGVAVYAAGGTQGTLPGQANLGGSDAFLIEIPLDATNGWTHQFGTAGTDLALGVAVDGGNVYVAGLMSGSLDGEPYGGFQDAFVRKYNPGGETAWTRQFGGPGLDVASGVSADGTGVYVAGQAALPETNAFLRKLDPLDGADVWDHPVIFGTTSFDQALAVSVRGSAVTVAGRTDGSLYATSQGAADGFAASFVAEDGALLWGTQFGSPFVVQVNAVATDGLGVIVAGQAIGLLFGDMPNGVIGGIDGFVRRLDASDGTRTWGTQFGSSGGVDDSARAVAAFGNSVYVVGDVNGPLPGQTHNGLSDAYVRTFNPDTGSFDSTTQFGSPGLDQALGVFVDPAQGIYVVGLTDGTLPGQTEVGGPTDAFVARFFSDGTLDKMVQFGTTDFDQANGVSGDATGIYVVGTKGQGAAADVFVTKFDFNLATPPLFAVTFGSPSGDAGNAVSAGPYGVYVAGAAFGALPLQPAPAGPSDAFVRELNRADGSEMWTRLIRTSGADSANGVAQDPSGVYVVGQVQGQLAGELPLSGVTDAYVRKLDFNGDEIGTQVIQSSLADNALAVAADDAGVYVAGQTQGVLPGQVSSGSTDAFMAKFATDLSQSWTRQFGSAGDDIALGVSADGAGVFVAGTTTGSLPGQTSAGATDAFVGPRLNTPPIAHAGADFRLECSSHAGTPVTLDGSGSSDSDGDSLTFEWRDASGNIVATTAAANLSLSLGTHTFTLTVDDGHGGADSDTVAVIVEDTTAPTLAVALTPTTLWPANHKLVEVRVSVTASDACDPEPRLTLTSVVSNEADDAPGSGDGHTTEDIRGAEVGTNDFAFFLRAERDGRRVGRVYTVTYSATDHTGNTISASALVRVPHD